MHRETQGQCSSHRYPGNLALVLLGTRAVGPEESRDPPSASHPTPQPGVGSGKVKSLLPKQGPAMPSHSMQHPRVFKPLLLDMLGTWIRADLDTHPPTG